METTISPTRERERILWIDAARGFAIFGIFIVNIGSFAAPYFLYGGSEYVWTSSVDQMALIGIDIFFQASFYTLFSILFGFGIEMMRENLLSKNIDVYPFLRRRLAILIVFGIIHAFMIWHGDILFSYGVIGLILLLFLRVRVTNLLIIAILLLGGTSALVTLLYIASGVTAGYVQWGNIEQAVEHYQSSHIPTILEQNYQDWVFANGGISFLFLLLIILPLFLIGMFLARKRLFIDLKYKNIRILLWGFSFIMFLLLKLGPYFWGNPLWFSFIQDNIGGTFSAIFYMLTIMWLGQNERSKRWLKPFVYVGRMALSNYIFQSIICFLLFYIFGLYGVVRPIYLVGIVIIVYLVQIFISRWWLQRYRFGVLEWVWRSFTYKKVQPLKRS